MIPNASPTAGRDRVPITVLTGFLGAGKTTLLNRILTADHGLRAAVLVNDFGAINIDAKLIVGIEGETVSLANGCVCCTMRDDLLTETHRLLARPDPPEYILIETSGVSDPRLIAQTLLDSDLSAVARIDGIVAVVDTDRLLELRGDDLALAMEQIVVADIVVLNKVDLVSGAKLESVRDRLSELVPRVRLLPAIHAQVPIELILGVGSFAEDRIAESARRAHIDGADGDGGDHLGHSVGYSSWHWTSDLPLSLAPLRSVIESLPASVHRGKGIVQLQEYPQYSVEMQLAGRRSELSAIGLWGDQTPRSEIVMIGSGDSTQFQSLDERFEQCTSKTIGQPFGVDWRQNTRRT